MKRLFLLFTVFLSFNVSAVTPPPIYIVYDLKNNHILSSHSQNVQHSIASLTKLMTAYVFLKYYNSDLKTCMSSISDHDKDTIKNTRTRIYKNKAISCLSLMQLMLLSSDNYAASALAGSIPNISRKQFYFLMNQEAKKIGMNQTFYADSSGLSFQNKSTAFDLLKMTKILMNEEIIQKMSGVYALNLKDGKKRIEFKNSNKLIRDNIYSAQLSKTGYISESGYNLIFVPLNECEDKKIAIIIMGAKSSLHRFGFAKDMLKKYGCVKN